MRSRAASGSTLPPGSRRRSREPPRGARAMGLRVARHRSGVRNLAATLYDPINVYKPVGPDIGIVDGPFEYLTVAGIGLPLPFTTRMTVVRLSSGDLVL